MYQDRMLQMIEKFNPAIIKQLFLQAHLISFLNRIVQANHMNWLLIQISDPNLKGQVNELLHKKFLLSSFILMLSLFWELVGKLFRLNFTKDSLSLQILTDRMLLLPKHKLLPI